METDRITLTPIELLDFLQFITAADADKRELVNLEIDLILYDRLDKAYPYVQLLSLKSSGAAVGICGLAITDDNQVEIFFRMLKKYCDSGLETEVAIAIFDNEFRVSKTKRIVAIALAEDIESQQMFLRWGLTFRDQKAVEGVMQYCYQIENYISRS